MRGIAGEQHASVAEALQAARLEAVEADPLEGEIDVLAQHGAHAAGDVVRLHLLVAVGLGADLEVEAPHVLGLAVQQRRAPAVEGRVEPEPALHGPLHLAS